MNFINEIRALFPLLRIFHHLPEALQCVNVIYENTSGECVCGMQAFIQYPRMSYETSIQFFIHWINNSCSHVCGCVLCTCTWNCAKQCWQSSIWLRWEQAINAFPGRETANNQVNVIDLSIINKVIDLALHKWNTNYRFLYFTLSPMKIGIMHIRNHDISFDFHHSRIQMHSPLTEVEE